MIGTEAALAGFAIDHGITEGVDVAGGLPDGGGHDDGGLKTDNVITPAGHGLPPEFLDVALELGAEGAVIPEAVDAAVNLGGLKNKAAAFAQRHDLFHLHIFFGFGHN